MTSIFDGLDAFQANASIFDGIDTETPKKSGTLRRIADVGVSLGKGAASIPELAVGLADIPTGGRIGKAVQDAGVDFKGIQRSISDLYSPEQQEANRKVQEAEGFGGTLKAAFQNPSTIVGAVAESAPLLIPGMAAARGLGAVSKLSGLARGAIGEGVTGAGLAAERTRQETEDGTLSAKQSLSALGSGAGTAALGAVGGKVANKLGIGDIDTYLAGQAQASKKGIVSRTFGGALAEGVFEELPQSIQEQVWQNYALGKPLDEGVAEAGAMGLLAGGAMGGAFSALNRGQAQPTPAPETLPTDPLVTTEQPALPEDQKYIGTPGSIQTPRTYSGNADEVAQADANAARIYAERDAFEQDRLEWQGLDPANIQAEFADELTASAANQFVSNSTPESYLQWAQSMDLGDFIMSMPNRVSSQALTINGILNGPFADNVKEQAAARLWKLGQDSRIQTIESLPADAGPLAKAAAQGAATGAIKLNKYGFTASIPVPGTVMQAGEQYNFANTLKGLPNAQGQRAVTQQLQESNKGWGDNQAGSGSTVSGRVGQPGQPDAGALEGREQSVVPVGDTKVADVQSITTPATPLQESAPAPVTQQSASLPVESAEIKTGEPTGEVGSTLQQLTKSDAGRKAAATVIAGDVNADEKINLLAIAEIASRQNMPIDTDHMRSPKLAETGWSAHSVITGEQLAAESQKPAAKESEAQGAEGKTEGVANTGIEAWRSEFDSAKKDGDKARIRALYDKARVALNGIAQARGAQHVADLEALKNDIEEYAQSVEVTPPASTKTDEVSAPAQAKRDQLKAEVGKAKAADTRANKSIDPMADAEREAIMAEAESSLDANTADELAARGQQDIFSSTTPTQKSPNSAERTESKPATKNASEQDKQQSISDQPETIPPSLKITIEGKANGKLSSKVVNARKAMNAANKRVSSLQALRGCLG